MATVTRPTYRYPDGTECKRYSPKEDRDPISGILYWCIWDSDNYEREGFYTCREDAQADADRANAEEAREG